MKRAKPPVRVLDRGTISFSIESRIVRELGERLVKQPEVALVELIKNSYDADATLCEVEYVRGSRIRVVDDGRGMTLDSFRDFWMRIGTSSKEGQPLSETYKRVITGEKGIGRFAVRFLGRSLTLESVAYDPKRRLNTLLIAHFNWVKFDRNEDLGKVRVPYRLVRAPEGRAAGTTLLITRLRPSVAKIKLDAVKSSSIAVVSPFRSLMESAEDSRHKTTGKVTDPGFSLKITPSEDPDAADLAGSVLQNAVLRAVVDLKGERLTLKVFKRDSAKPVLHLSDRYPNHIGRLHADIRFFPQRKGTFTELGVNGAKAREWIRRHSGVAVFDRGFRVLPYGLKGDDWLVLAADAARRAREPRSNIAKKHFPMDDAIQSSTQLNYMLRLPYPDQLVGIVEVQGRRSVEQTEGDQGLIAAADREGFVNNQAFAELFDVVRGAVEALASEDRELQLELERSEQLQIVRALRSESRKAIKDVMANPHIRRSDKAQIVKKLASTYVLAERYQEQSKERESSLEVMSLLGVVAGFMTHEFGMAIHELERGEELLRKHGARDVALRSSADKISIHRAQLLDFVGYAQGYVQGASGRPARPYLVRPRLLQVVRVFGKYAEDRQIDLKLDVDSELQAPLVPVSLYNGVALNLFTNALKALTAKTGVNDRLIAFKAWNERDWHYLEVVDTGIGIPPAMRSRVFDPLFTTTATNRDPLGSGMGLGLALVKRGVEAFGGSVAVVDPPAGYTTCVQVKLPIKEAE